jgi:hypothetical protein
MVDKYDVEMTYYLVGNCVKSVPNETNSKAEITIVWTNKYLSDPADGIP